MALLYQGRDFSDGLRVHDWRETGLHFEDGSRWIASRNGRVPNKVALHWTGGEGDERDVFEVLKNRVGVTASTHLYVRYDGEVFQFADLGKTTWHIGDALTARESIGIEVQGKGYPPVAANYPRQAYRDRIHGSEATMLAYSPAQMDSVRKLLTLFERHLGIPAKVPADSSGKLITRLLTTSERRAFKGVIGHYHVTESGKRDPGTQPLRVIQEYGGSTTVGGYAPLFAAITTAAMMGFAATYAFYRLRRRSR